MHMNLLKLRLHPFGMVNSGRARTPRPHSVPKESGAYGAVGNTASCTAQGFFDSFLYGISVFMNAVLAFTYCVFAKRGWRDEATSTRSLWMVSTVLSSFEDITLGLDHPSLRTLRFIPSLFILGAGITTAYMLRVGD